MKRNIVTAAFLLSLGALAGTMLACKKNPGQGTPASPEYGTQQSTATAPGEQGAPGTVQPGATTPGATQPGTTQPGGTTQGTPAPGGTQGGQGTGR